MFFFFSFLVRAETCRKERRPSCDVETLCASKKFAQSKDNNNNNKEGQHPTTHRPVLKFGNHQIEMVIWQMNVQREMLKRGRTCTKGKHSSIHPPPILHIEIKKKNFRKFLPGHTTCFLGKKKKEKEKENGAFKKNKILSHTAYKDVLCNWIFFQSAAHLKLNNFCRRPNKGRGERKKKIADGDTVKFSNDFLFFFFFSLIVCLELVGF